MTLKDIAAISGKPGLYKILKPTRNGVIVESIDEKAAKMAVNANQRISVLKDISVYVSQGEEESVPLQEVFANMLEKHPEGIKTDINDADSLRTTLKAVLPNFDREKVYVSDIKKMVLWFNTLLANYPEVFEKEAEATDAQTSAEVEEAAEEKKQ